MNHRIPTLPRIATALALSAMAACGSAEPGTTSATGDLAGPDVPLQIETEDVYTVGTVSGADWEMFSRVSRVAFDGAGNLYVYDADARRITVVDPGGAQLRTVGSPGDGPGEFRQPMGVAVFDDGTVAAYDLGHQALMVFDPDGEMRESIRMPMTGLIPGSALYPHPRGGLVSPDGMSIGMMGPGDEAPAEPTTRPVAYFALEEAPPETLYDAWLMPPLEADEVSVSGGGFQMVTRPMVAFEPEVHLGVFSDGSMALVDSTAYRIRILDAHGAVTGTLDRPIQPREVSESDRDAERQRRLDELSGPNAPRGMMVMDGGGGGGPPPDFMKRIMEQQIAGMLFAAEIPVIAGLAVDRGGRIWVERTGHEIGATGPTDLLTRDGAYLGTLGASGVKTPDAFGPDGLLAYIEHDEMDVPLVIVQRLPAEYR